MYTGGSSNKRGATAAVAGGHRTLLPPLFIHLLSHLALLVIPAPTPNQIYHTVRAASVLTVFPLRLSCLFHIGNFQSWGFSFSSPRFFPLNVCLFFAVIYLFHQQISLKALSDEGYLKLGHTFNLWSVRYSSICLLIAVLIFGRCPKGLPFFPEVLFFFVVWQIKAAIIAVFLDRVKKGRKLFSWWYHMAQNSPYSRVVTVKPSEKRKVSFVTSHRDTGTWVVPFPLSQVLVPS